MKILAIGDIVGESGRDYLCARLWAYRRAHDIDLVVANGENVRMGEGNGIDPASAEVLLAAGVDVLTGGNHTFRRSDYYAALDDSRVLLRPANYPSAAPGYGDTIVEAAGARVLVMNVMGTMFLESLACPFETVDKILARRAGEYDVAVLDVHAEATSEKAALARYFDGRVQVVFGTHTHVQTNDACVLPQGTGFLTDLGMTGPTESILGVDAAVIIEMMRSKLHKKFTLSAGKVEAQGAVFTVAVQNGVMARTIIVENVKF